MILGQGGGGNTELDSSNRAQWFPPYFKLSPGDQKQRECGENKQFASADAKGLKSIQYNLELQGSVEKEWNLKPKHSD